MRKKYLLFFLLVLIFSCFSNYVEKASFTREGGSIILFENGGSILGISLKKEFHFQFSEKLNKNELQSFFRNFKILGRKTTEKRLIKIDPFQAVLDIISYEKGKRETLINNFLNLNPKYCEGFIDSVSSELFKGEQNIGKYGVLLPLYKIGCNEFDWVLFDIKEKKNYFFEEGKYLKEITKLPIHSDCGGTIYCGQNHYAIISPKFELFATLSKKGRLHLCNFQLGKILLKRENVTSFCFHPEKKLLYFGTESGLYVFDCESYQFYKLTNNSPRLIRISQKGSYLFIIEAGGENETQILSLDKWGKKVKKNGKVDLKIENADDWVFVDDFTILAVFNSKSYVVLKNLLNGDSEKINFRKDLFAFVLNSSIFPTIILKRVDGQPDKEELFYFNLKTKRFDKTVPFIEK